MARISTYTKDTVISDDDLLVGSNYIRTYNGKKEYNTRSFLLNDLATYFNKRITTFRILDEDDMASNSAIYPPSQQSVKAYVDTQVSSEDTLAEMNDTNISSLASANILIYDGSDSWDNKALSGDATIATTGALTLASSQTNITSILNTSLVTGRDADNQIKYSTDNQIIFRVDGGDNVVFKTSGEIEATSLDISGDADIDGTLEADAITVDGTTLSEYIADTTGAMFTSNTETFITATYDDSDNTIDLVVPVKDEDNMASDSASHLATQQSIKAYVDDKIQTQEEVEDIVGGMLDGTETFISVDYDDTDGNIDFVVPVKDEDNMASNSATHLATQQSIKAYVDTQVDTEDTLAELDDTNISSAAAGQILVYDNTASVWDNVALTAGDLIDVTGGDGTLEIDVDLTEASEAAIANGDYMLFLDGGATGTPKKEALHDIATLFSGTGLTATNSVIAVDAAQTQITSVGTLNAGAISSGFGNIDNGSSTLNTGAATVDSLSVSDGNITNVGDIALDTISADGTTINVAMTDNTDGAFSVKQGSDKYIAIDTTDTGEDIAIGTGVSGTAITIGHTTSETTIQDNLTVTGNLKVNGDQVYQNVTSMAVTDPIISLQTGTDGANLGADSNKDVGLAMFWHNGSAAKTAFLGFDDSAGKLTFIPDASISSEVVSGSVGIMVANLEGNVTGDLTGTVQTAAQTNITSLGTLTTLSVDNITINGNDISTTNSNGDLTISPNGTGNVNVYTDSLQVVGTEGEAARLALIADEADDSGDIWSIVSETGNTLTINSDKSGSAVAQITLTPHATVASSTTAIAGLLTVGGALTVGVDDTGHDVQFFGDTASKYMLWDTSLDALFLPDDTKLLLGTGQDAGIYVSSDDLYIDQSTTDKDIIFKGTDGGADITALTLDMSEGGAATFAGIVTTDKIFVAKGQNLAHTASSIKVSQESTIKSQIRCYGADASTAGTFELLLSASDGTPNHTALAFDNSANATFAGRVDISKGAVNGTSFADNQLLRLLNTSTTDGSRMGLGFTGNTSIGSMLAMMEGVNDDQSAGHTSIRFSTYGGSWNTDMFILGSDGNATFTGSVTTTSATATDFVNVKADDAEIYWTIAANNDYWRWRRDASDNFILDHYNGSGTGTALSFDGSQNATFGEHVSLSDSKEIRFGTGTDANIRHDGNNTKFSHTGSGGLYIGADTIGLQSGDHSSYTSATFTSSGTTLGTGTVAAANAAADDFVIKGPGTTATGMTISNTSDSGTGTIFFGDTTSSSVAGFRYNHNTGDMAISAEDDVNFTCDNASFSGGLVVNEGSNDADFRVESNGEEYMIRVDAGNNRVGIATQSPSTTFEVTGDSTFAGNVDIGGNELKYGPKTKYKWTDRMSAVSGQDKKYHIMRMYFTPNHWSDDNQDIEIELQNEYYSVGSKKYRLQGWYGMGNGNSWKLWLQEINSTFAADGVTYAKVTLGSATDAGWDYSSQNVYYQDVYVEVNYYLQVSVTATFNGHGYQTSNPTSGGAATVVYTSPTATNITYSVPDEVIRNYWPHCFGDHDNVVKMNDSVINVGAGTTHAGISLGQANSAGNYRQLYVNASTSTVLYFYNGTNQATLTNAGVWTDASDEKLKKDIKDLTYGLDEVLKLKPRKYKMKADNDEQIGFVAQEVETVIPEVVDTHDDPKSGEQKTLAYSHMTAVLTKAIQELEARVKELENK